MKKTDKLQQLKQTGEAPDWMTDEGFKTLSGTYLLPGESPKAMWERVSNSVAGYLNKPELAARFFDLLWKNWLGLASPVAANCGTDRGLPISCFSTFVPDSIDGIMGRMHELATMTKNGGGVGVHWNKVRPRNAIIRGNGRSEGVVPFIKIQDSTTVGVSQGGVRRGASAAYLPVEHGDFWEFIKMRRPEGDQNRQCQNVHHGVNVTDEFMQSLKDGHKENRLKWQEILKTRMETGEPYIFFTDTVKNSRPESYVKNNLEVNGSNICCLSGDTLVATKAGPARIDELCGKEVEIWDGKEWVVTDTFSERGQDKLLRVTIADGSYVDCNAKHRWFVAKTYEDIRNGRYVETVTEDLRVGTWLEAATPLQCHGSIIVKGAYLKGFLLGDGTHISDRPLLRLHSTKYACADKLVDSGKEISPSSATTSTIRELSFGEEHVYTGGNGAYGKQELKNMRGLSARKRELRPWTDEYKAKLPDEVFSWDRKSKLEFLAGLFDADGTVSKNNCLQISSIHMDFIKSLQLLLKTLGCSSSIDISTKRAKNIARLTVGSLDASDLLSEMPTQRIKRNADHVPNRRSTGWRRIVSIEALTDTPVPVYCPTLPTTGKFALANGLMTGNTEILLATDELHSFVCCLSSLNLARWDEWKDTDAVELSVWFLDGVLSEFIDKASKIEGMERSVRSAVAGRALGLGVFGFHTYLQEHSVVLDSFECFQINAQMFSGIKRKAEKATHELAAEYGEPEWCKGLNRRNTHLIALAPTVSNSLISGNLSPSIEPWAANVFVQKSAKGTIIQKNKTLTKLLESYGKNNEATWKSIERANGSVQHLDFLTAHEKEVFLTAREMNQFALVKLAAQRQRWIDQGQSLNLFFPENSDPKYIHDVHVMAHEEGLRTLYYLRTSSVIRGDAGSREYRRESTECKACEG